jgi:hypothetical protein
VISKKDGERGAASGDNYQDDIITHADDDWEAFHDDDDNEETVLEAVSKVYIMLLSCCDSRAANCMANYFAVSFARLCVLFAQVHRGGRTGLGKFDCRVQTNLKTMQLQDIC